MIEDSTLHSMWVEGRNSFIRQKGKWSWSFPLKSRRDHTVACSGSTITECSLNSHLKCALSLMLSPRKKSHHQASSLFTPQVLAYILIYTMVFTFCKAMTRELFKNCPDETATPKSDRVEWWWCDYSEYERVINLVESYINYTQMLTPYLTHQLWHGQTTYLTQHSVMISKRKSPSRLCSWWLNQLIVLVIFHLKTTHLNHLVALAS